MRKARTEKYRLTWQKCRKSTSVKKVQTYLKGSLNSKYVKEMNGFLKNKTSSIRT